MTTTTQENKPSAGASESFGWYKNLPKALAQHQLILFVASTISIVLDQATKWWVEANIPLYDRIVPIAGYGHILDFLHVKNPGAAFGAGQQFGWLFATIAFIVSAGIIFYNTVIIGKHFAFRLSLGLIMGGALGNVIDRFRIGEVTDFIHFDFRPLVSEAMAEAIPLLNFAIFNLADLSIFSGVLIMFWLMWKDTLPEDPWLDDIETDSDTAQATLAKSPEVELEPATRLSVKPQSVPAQRSAPPRSYASVGSVPSGLTRAPIDSASTGRQSGLDWRGLNQDETSEENARYGLIAGLVIGLSLVAVVVVLISRRRARNNSKN